MKVWLMIAGGLSLAFGVLFWLTMAGAVAFREGFGGEEVSGLWFFIPALITFGGPVFFWIVLPGRANRFGPRGRQ